MAERPGPVLVTGANSGIGLATTLLLAKRGWATWGTVRSKAKATDCGAPPTAAGVGVGHAAGARRRRRQGGRRPLARAAGVLRRRQQRRLLRARSGRGGVGAAGARPSSTSTWWRRPSCRPAPCRRCASAARPHRDGLVDRRAGGDHAAERVVPRVEVRPRGTLGRAADGGRRLRHQGRDRRAGLLPHRHRLERSRLGPTPASPTTTRPTPPRTVGRRAVSTPSSASRRRPTPWPASSPRPSRPADRCGATSSASTPSSVASTHPLIPRALTDAATRLVTGLGGGPATYT